MVHYLKVLIYLLSLTFLAEYYIFVVVDSVLPLIRNTNIVQPPSHNIYINQLNLQRL